MPRPLVILLVGVTALMAGQFVYQKLGPVATAVLAVAVAAVAAVGYAVSVNHPIAHRLAAHRLGRPVVRLACVTGGLAMPAPPPAAKSTAGGPALRTPAEFDRLRDSLRRVVIGQDAVVEAVSAAVRRDITLRVSSTALTPRRPLVVLLLTGGDGLGKRTLLEAVGRAVYPDSGVRVLDLAAVPDLPAAVAPHLAADPCQTLVLEHLDAAGPKAVDAIRRAAETGVLCDPAGGPLASVGACVLGLTASEPAALEAFGPAFRAAVGEPIRFARPAPRDIAAVVVRQMQAECQAHGVALEFVAPPAVARVAVGFDPRGGFRLTAGAVADVLRPEIARAVEHGQRRLAILEETR